MKTKTIIISLIAVIVLAVNGFAVIKYFSSTNSTDKSTTERAGGIVSAPMNFDSVKQSLSTSGKWVKVTKNQIDPNYIKEDVNQNGDNNDNIDNSAAGVENVSNDEYTNSDQDTIQDEYLNVDPNDNQDQNMDQQYNDGTDENLNSAENNDVDVDINVDYVWVPNTNTQADFNPYSNGSWQWSDEGWVWESNYGWDCTYHYGRWWYSDEYGWVWSPGDQWAPSWVDWCSAGGYTGWHPISPREHHHGWTGWNTGNHHHPHIITDPHWVFIPTKNFAGTITPGNTITGERTKTLLTTLAPVDLKGDGVKIVNNGPNPNDLKGVQKINIQKPVTNIVNDPRPKIDVSKNPNGTKNVIQTTGTPKTINTQVIDKTKNVTVGNPKNVTIDKTKNVTVTGTKNTNNNTIDKTKYVTQPKVKQDNNTVITKNNNVDKTKTVTTQPKVQPKNNTIQKTNDNTKVTTQPKINTSKADINTKTVNNNSQTYTAPKVNNNTQTYSAPKTNTYVPQTPKVTKQEAPVQKQSPVVQKPVEQKPVIQKSVNTGKSDKKSGN